MTGEQCKDILYSWSKEQGVNSTSSILKWVEDKNTNLHVLINKIDFNECDGWYYNESKGTIENAKGAFFSIVGTRTKFADSDIIEQPMIIQDEIGYLGIICKKIDGCLHFLMQAKIEPGNINKIQISPTIQATKSNFTQKHGGRKPAYLDYFLNSKKYSIIVDQIQSEQSSRFVGKRNRNIIIMLDENENINVLNSHAWMTLGQIKQLMKIDNLVNMDTRTVLSCIPFSTCGVSYDVAEPFFKNKALCRSIFNDDEVDLSTDLFRCLNNNKMFCDKKFEYIPLKEMSRWVFSKNEIYKQESYSYKVIFCDISIEGREVKRWSQPLFAATGIATFALITRVKNSKLEFLIRLKREIGCFDVVEFGPSIQRESGKIEKPDFVENFCESVIGDCQRVRMDVLLSEEGGRFYKEQNRNLLIEIEPSELQNLPEDYFWVDYKTINFMCQFNNVINIQLRNLLSLWEA